MIDKFKILLVIIINKNLCEQQYISSMILLFKHECKRIKHLIVTSILVLFVLEVIHDLIC